MYSERNIVDYNKLEYLRCYVCDKFLIGTSSRDHIIPKAIFSNHSAENRPTLRIHPACNNDTKSREDRWFSKHLLLRAQGDPATHQGITDFLHSADRGRSDVDGIASDKKAFADFKLANTILTNNSTAYLRSTETGDHQPFMRYSAEAISREENYIRLISKGLIIRNASLARVNVDDEVTISQYSGLRAEGLFDNYMRDLSKLFLSDIDNCFVQSWGDRATYIVSPRYRMVFIEFWKQVGYFTSFDIEFPRMYVRTRESLPARLIRGLKIR